MITIEMMILISTVKMSSVTDVLNILMVPVIQHYISNLKIVFCAAAPPVSQIVPISLIPYFTNTITNVCYVSLLILTLIVPGYQIQYMPFL